MSLRCPIYITIATLVVCSINVQPITSDDSDDVTRALVVIDVQNCFMPPDGSLAVVSGEEIVPTINWIRSRYSTEFKTVVMTKDWHCVDHVSFASQHPRYKPYDVVNLTYTQTGDLCTDDVILPSNPHAINCSASERAVQVGQVLWPDHCVMNTADSSLYPTLNTGPADVVVNKGYHCQIDSYSGFYDNGGLSQTELDEKLKEHHVTSVYIVGLATDYCVYYTAKDAHRLGYDTWVILDATRGINDVTVARAVSDLQSIGVKLINSTDLELLFSSASSPVLYNSSTLTTVAIIVYLILLHS